MLRSSTFAIFEVQQFPAGAALRAVRRPQTSEGTMQLITVIATSFVCVRAFAPTSVTGTSSRLGKTLTSPHFATSEESAFDLESVRASLDRIVSEDCPSDTLSAFDEVESQYGMPWKESIDAKAFKGEELFYMPFWEWHTKFMKENLTDLKVHPCSNDDRDFSFNENSGKKARIVNMHLSSKEYRKIRLTYYDAGEKTQVYNAVFYPDPKYNLPVLGIDLLAFNRMKYLAIVDFQPLHENEQEHEKEFSHLLEPIKSSFKSLNGKMSSRFYDETKFFSQQMLFSRFEDSKIVTNELFPAFQQYVQTHLDLVRSCEGNADEQAVMERQKAYDTYSAERDPATGLFAAMFGQEWAMDFVHDFLFSMSERPAPGSPMPAPPMFGGNPHAQSKQSSQTAGVNPFAGAPKPAFSTSR